jgi:hypothetical protein
VYQFVLLLTCDMVDQVTGARRGVMRSEDDQEERRWRVHDPADGNPVNGRRTLSVIDKRWQIGVLAEPFHGATIMMMASLGSAMKGCPSRSEARAFRIG